MALGSPPLHDFIPQDIPMVKNVGHWWTHLSNPIPHAVLVMKINEKSQRCHAMTERCLLASPLVFSEYHAHHLSIYPTPFSSQQSTRGSLGCNLRDDAPHPLPRPGPRYGPDLSRWVTYPTSDSPPHRLPAGLNSFVAASSLSFIIGAGIALGDGKCKRRELKMRPSITGNLQLSEEHISKASEV